MRASRIALGVLVILASSVCHHAGATLPSRADEIRNPFDVKDIPEPNDKAVEDFAERVKLEGDAKDANAEQWVKEVTAAKKGSLEGDWTDRWNSHGGDWHNGTESTKIRAIADRVYMLVNASNGKYLIDVKREKNLLIGKYRGVDNPNDTGPIMLLVVDDERIDGNWNGVGRWDFRRKLE